MSFLKVTYTKADEVYVQVLYWVGFDEVCFFYVFLDLFVWFTSHVSHSLSSFLTPVLADCWENRNWNETHEQMKWPSIMFIMYILCIYIMYIPQ